MFGIRLTRSTPKMSCPDELEEEDDAIDGVAEYKEARAKFVLFLTTQASLITHQPKPDTLDDVKINLEKQSIVLLNEIIRAALYMATDAPEHPFVLAKQFGWYDEEVVKICRSLKQRLPLLAKRLKRNAKCDMCVSFSLLNIVEDLEF